MAKRRGPRRSREREARWRQRISQWRKSGVTIRSFCRRHRLKETAFYYWRRELKRRASQRPRKKPSNPGARFVPVRVVSPPNSSVRYPIEIALRSGRVLRVETPIDLEELTRLVAAVESAAC